MGSGSVGLVFDERMCSHANPWDPSHPEKPARLLAIVERLKSAGVFQRCIHVEAREATDNELATVHTKDHIGLMRSVSSKAYGKEGRKGLARRYNSIYFNEGSSESALLAAGSVVEISIQVARDELGAGAAVVRPPGHHAETDDAMGFCLFNNVAVAAHVLVHEKPELGIHRALIVDWDVHHGNGTQHMFWTDPHVLYFSVHRYDNGSFYPIGNEGSYDKVGEGNGAGFNINVPWPHGGFGDADYLAVWDHVLMPVAKDFNPDIVLVSAGFDSAEGDPLGGCRLTPYGYSQMTRKLMDLAKGRVVLALEGGYNLLSISESYLSCLQVLLGDPPSNSFSLPKPFVGTWSLIQKVRNELQKFWPVLGECTEFLQRQLLEATSISNEERLADMGLSEEESLEDCLDVDKLLLEDRDHRRQAEVGIAATAAGENQFRYGQVESPEEKIEHLADLTTKMESDSENSLLLKGNAIDVLKKEEESQEDIVGEVYEKVRESRNQQIPEADLSPAGETSISHPMSSNQENTPEADLSPAGETSISHPIGSNQENISVWYASYGSNMWKPRFMCYLQGGQVEGMATSCAGSRDKRAPIATAWMEIGLQLFFGRSYTVTWGSGGVAFLELMRTEGVSTHVHLYRITLEQFNDIFVQENMAGPRYGSQWVDTSLIDALRQRASSSASSVELIKDAWYGSVLYLGEKDGFPILTFTCSESHIKMFKSGSLPVCPPSETYRWAVARGLVEHKNLSREEALAYVSSKY